MASNSGSGSEEGTGRKRVSRTLDPVYLSIFAHRFMGIAEQMGRTLQVGFRRNCKFFELPGMSTVGKGLKGVEQIII